VVVAVVQMTEVQRPLQAVALAVVVMVQDKTDPLELQIQAAVVAEPALARDSRQAVTVVLEL
jgi:hypothetical protein